jgi:predicted small metal-binding protein
MKSVSFHTIESFGKEVREMAYTLACSDFGEDCPYVAGGETIDEVIADGGKHAKEVHGYTDEQLNDPKFVEEAKKVIKKT